MSKGGRREDGMNVKLKRKTNVQVVQGIMNFSQHGALAQAFVMEAIAQYSAMVIKNPPPPDPKAIVPSDVWVKVAEEVQAKLQEHYGEPS